MKGREDMETVLTEKMRNAIRVSSKAEPITEEINDCIEACKRDLQQVGIRNLDERDALIIQAIKLYCKAEFGYNEKAQQYRQSYDSLKVALSLMDEYITEPEKKPEMEQEEGGTDGE